MSQPLAAVGVKTVECPTCGAEPGRACVTVPRARIAGGRPRGAYVRAPHAARTAAVVADEIVAGCQWWALCTNEATGAQAHPILGDVPICDRCRAKYEALGG